METSENFLRACLDEAAKRRPNSAAIIHDNCEITYSELLTSVLTVAKGLIELNIEPGGRIALIANKTPETIAIILAAQRLQVILVIINPQLKTPQVKHILNDSSACALFCDQHTANSLTGHDAAPDCLQKLVLMPSSRTSNTIVSQAYESWALSEEKVSNLKLDFLLWKNFINALSTYPSENADLPKSKDTAIVLYTSGSTGKPKGVKLSHSNLYFGAASVSTYLQNTHNDRILGLLPLSFDYGLSQLTTSIFSGAALVLHDYITPKGVIKAALKHRISGIPAVPHIWDQLMKIDWPLLDKLRYVTSTGGRLQTETIRILRQKLPDVDIYSMYGFTEAFRATYLPPTELRYRPNSIGKAVPYATVLVVDKEGRELPPGEQGELIQSGPLVSNGYWNDEPASAEKFRKRQFKNSPSEIYAWSGDFAYRDEDGFIYFVTRKDDQVKLNGYRVSPTEIESALLECLWIAEASVACIPSDKFGYVAIAFVVLGGPVKSSVLTIWCKQNIPSYMVPTQWIVMDELPSTPNNKIDREALRAYLHSNDRQMPC